MKIHIVSLIVALIGLVAAIVALFLPWFTVKVAFLSLEMSLYDMISVAKNVPESFRVNIRAPETTEEFLGTASLISYGLGVLIGIVALVSKKAKIASGILLIVAGICWIAMIEMIKSRILSKYGSLLGASIGFGLGPLVVMAGGVFMFIAYFLHKPEEVKRPVAVPPPPPPPPY